MPEAMDDNPEADMTWEDIYDDDYLDGFANQPKKIEDTEGFQEDWVADSASFDTRLEQAIYCSPLNVEEQAIAKLILEHLDDNYFLSVTPQELAKTLKIDDKKVVYVIDIIKHLDPAGVASSGIQDCMLAQLHSADNNSDTAVNAHEILSEYFDYIDKKPGFIQKRLAISDSEYNRAMQLIRGLSPYPNPAESSSAQLIKPDVFVRKRMGFYFASPNKDARFDLSVNESYAELTQHCQGDEKHFMKAQLQQAKFFIDALSQRYKTVVRVANAIVMEQQDFFTAGEKAIRPLVMREIAEHLDLSESTISRAVNGKYLSFKGRLIELKYFFVQGVSGAAGGDDASDAEPATSSTAVKAHIKEIIDQEPPKKPLSDSKIEAALKALGIDISRRTVAKYRESLGIPKMSQRKRLR